jgi:hypothetical protein
LVSRRVPDEAETAGGMSNQKLLAMVGESKDEFRSQKAEFGVLQIDEETACINYL